MVLAGTTIAIIEKRFADAAAWCGTAAGLAAVGLVHSYRFTPGDVVFALEPAWPWATGYATMAGVLLAARWLTEPDVGY